MATILCVDDDPGVLSVLRATLERAGHRSIPVNNGPAALTVLERGNVDLVVSDYSMPDMTGLELLDRLRERGIEVPIILVTGHGTIEGAVSAMKSGAVDYLTKPFTPRELEVAVEQALELIRLRRENRTLKSEVRQLREEREIVGSSEEIQRVLELVRTVAPTRSTVLIEGESGTGKELIARAIHTWSDRADEPFISVNCAALPEHLIESSLFGHEKGAFTGAVRTVRGAFERAHRGTLLLDEVTEMRLDLQAKLLRVLQEQEFERVGGSTPISVDVRVVATTNRDLKSAIQTGAFREDLYYRLAVVPIRVPPLRDRKDDIPALAGRFAQQKAREVGRAIEGIAPDAMARLTDHDWPGNVRELAHAMERAVILSPGSVIPASAFELRTATAGPGPHGGAGGTGAGAAGAAGVGSPTGGAGAGGPGRDHDPDDPHRPVVLDTVNLKEAEEALIQRALERTGQNRTRAAELLGVSVRTLRNRLNG